MDGSGLISSEFLQVRRVIGVDLDDVLIEFSLALSSYIYMKYGIKYTLYDIPADYDLTSIWKCSHDDVLKNIFEFYLSEDHMNILPTKGAIEALQFLIQDFDIVVITSRPQSVEDITIKLLRKHFPEIFKKIYFVNTYIGPDKKSKAQVCIENNVELFIDDLLSNTISTSEAGIPTIIFDRPWNRINIRNNGRTVRCKNWKSIVKLAEGIRK